MKKPTFAKTGIDGSCELFGVNIFDYKWKTEDGTAMVKNPAGGAKIAAKNYSVTLNGEKRLFTAVKLSDALWAFYL